LLLYSCIFTFSTHACSWPSTSSAYYYELRDCAFNQRAINCGHFSGSGACGRQPEPRHYHYVGTRVAASWSAHFDWPVRRFPACHGAVFVDDCSHLYYDSAGYERRLCYRSRHSHLSNVLGGCRGNTGATEPPFRFAFLHLQVDIRAR
jgi:hypothetical protein